MQYFKIVVGSELDGTRSHKAEVIEEVFNQLNLHETEKVETLMVGDREYDVLGAKACGIHCVGVEFGYEKENELKLAGAEYIVKDVKELEDLLIHSQKERDIKGE